MITIGSVQHSHFQNDQTWYIMYMQHAYTQNYWRWSQRNNFGKKDLGSNVPPNIFLECTDKLKVAHYHTSQLVLNQENAKNLNVDTILNEVEDLYSFLLHDSKPKKKSILHKKCLEKTCFSKTNF